MTRPLRSVRRAPSIAAFTVICLAASLVARPVFAGDGQPGQGLIPVPSVGAAAPLPSPQVVGGGEVDPPGAYPFMVSVQTGGSHFCGGTLVTSRHVLSAAHCFTDRSGRLDIAAHQLTAVVGRHDLTTSTGHELAVSAIDVHPRWDGEGLSGRFDWDVAVLKLATEVASGSPIALAGAAETPDFEPGDPGTTMGWGDTDGSAPWQTTNRLMEVDVPFTSNAACAAVWGSAFFAGLQICAGDLASGGVDSCVGDSGGPIVAPPGPSGWKQVGIVSSGPVPCGAAGRPGIYGFVPNLRSYIVAASGGVNAPPVAHADALGTPPGMALAIDIARDLLDDDTDDHDAALLPDSFVVSSGPGNGTLVPDGPGRLRYTPDQGFAGTDGFTYTIQDSALAASSGSVTISVGSPVVPLAVSLATPGPIDLGSLGGVTGADIVAWDGAFTMLFDASDVGLTHGADVDAFARFDGGLLLSFAEPIPSFPGPGPLSGLPVDDSDVIRFDGTLGEATSGGFSAFLVGAQVGLTTNGEDVDALALLGDGSLLLSTTGLASVGSIRADDSDVLRFVPQAPGDYGAGTWEPWLVGADLGLTTSSEDLDAIAIDGNRIGLSTLGQFSTPPLSGRGEDVMGCDGFVAEPAGTSCGSPLRLLLDGSADAGITVGVDGLDLTVTAAPPTRPAMVFSTVLEGPTSIGSLTGVADEDLVRFDGTTFSLVFDGSRYGLESTDVDAVHPVSGGWVLSFAEPLEFPGPGPLFGMPVDDSDLVRFDGATETFSMFFDGSDHGLTTNGEDIDAVSILPDGRIVISTTGGVSVPGGVRGADEDLLLFTPLQPNDLVAGGTWNLYLDGSGFGLADSSSEDVDGATPTAEGTLYFSTVGSVTVGALSARDEDVIACEVVAATPIVTCHLPRIFFDGSRHGLGADDLDAIHVEQS